MIASLMMGTNPREIPNNHCAQMNILLWNCRGALNMDFKTSDGNGNQSFSNHHDSY